MNWPVWREVEEILVRADISPILAVIPANEDPTLQFQPPNEMFWDEVRRWQSRGWTIGLHGFRHAYDSTDSGLIGKNRFSEFAGIPKEMQGERIGGALEVFCREGVRPDLWIAPAHSFDQTTLESLREHGLPCVSDGFFLYPGLDRRGTFWVPQQLSDFKSALFGVWTICLHPNWWTAARLDEFRKGVERYRGRFLTFGDVFRRYSTRRLDWRDRTTSELLGAQMKARRTARRLWPRREVAPGVALP